MKAEPEVSPDYRSTLQYSRAMWIPSAPKQKNHFSSKHDLFEGGHYTATLLRETPLNSLTRNHPVAVREDMLVWTSPLMLSICTAHRSLMVQHWERLVAPSPACVGTGMLLPAALLAMAAASAPRTWEGSGRGVQVCDSSPCKDSNTYLDRYMGNEALSQKVPTMPLGHHCSSPNSSSGALPRCCVHLCGPSKSQSKNGLESCL